MTNFEWLCKENKLEEFIEEISLSGEYILYGGYNTYKIDAKYGDWRKSVAEWLKAEHKANTTKWVKLDDVLRAIGEPAVPLLPKDNKCIKSPDERELYERVNKIIDNRVKKIKALETKEIDDD